MRECGRCGEVHPKGACPTPQRERSEDVQKLVGSVVSGKYVIEEVLGEGGMGVVYGASDRTGGPPIALKVLHPRVQERREATARLANEARVAGSLEHPNICKVVDLGEVRDGRPFVAMERLYGETLADRLQREERLRFGEACRIACGVLAGLQRAHDVNVIHRDLKPDNVFLEVTAGGDVHPKVLDFGISKIGGSQGMILTETGMVMGTPYYMAPEQARGDRKLDQRVDLWAMGVILYEVLTGRRPFVAKNYNALLVRILTAAPTPIGEIEPSVPKELRDVVDALLAKDPKQRPVSAGEVARTISPFADPGRPSWVEISVEETYSEDPTAIFIRKEVFATQPKAEDMESTVVDPPRFDEATTTSESE